MREHWIALLSALCTALLVSSPLIAFPFYAGSQYKGINIYHIGTDEHQYLSRGKEALEGHNLGQPFLSEGKSLQDPSFDTLEPLIVFPLRLLGLNSVNIVTFYNVLNFFGIFALTLAIYAFSLRLCTNRYVAAAAAVFVICGATIVENKTLFSDSFNIYGRSLFPYAASLPFFLYLTALHIAYTHPRRYLYVAIAGGLGGFLFYEYFYAWSFELAFVAALCCVCLFTRRWIELRAVFFTGLIAVVLGSINFIPLLLYYASDVGARLGYFWYSAHSHAFVMSITGTATALLFIIYRWFAREDTQWPFVLASILAGWISLEQQFVTGRLVDYGHYYWYFVIPLSIIIGLYMASRFLPARWYAPLSIFLIVLAFFNTIGTQWESFYVYADTKLHEQAYGPLLSDLRSRPYGVVLSGTCGETYPYLVTIYTNDDLYWCGGALIYDVPIERIEESLLVYLALNTDARSKPIEYLKQKMNAHTVSAYTTLYEAVEGYRSGLDYEKYNAALERGAPIPNRNATLVELTALEKKLFPTVASLRTFLIKNGVRYVLWDRSVYPEWDLSPLEPLTKIDESGDVVLYQIDQ